MGLEPMDRAGRGMKRIVEEGWEDKASNVESPEELLKSAIFALRRDIGTTRHQFEEEDGGVREPNPNVVVGDPQEARQHRARLVENFRRQKTILTDALVHVEYEVLPQQKKPTIEYLNQVGGAYNYVANMVLERVADLVTSVDEMDSILRNFMSLFFHVSGWERFTEKVQRRLSSKDIVSQKTPAKSGLMGWLRRDK